MQSKTYNAVCNHDFNIFKVTKEPTSKWSWNYFLSYTSQGLNGPGTIYKLTTYKLLLLRMTPSKTVLIKIRNEILNVIHHPRYCNCFQVKYKNYKLNYYLPNTSQVIQGQVQDKASLMLLDHEERMPWMSLEHPQLDLSAIKNPYLMSYT